MQFAVLSSKGTQCSVVIRYAVLRGFSRIGICSIPRTSPEEAYTEVAPPHYVAYPLWRSENDWKEPGGYGRLSAINEQYADLMRWATR